MEDLLISTKEHKLLKMFQAQLEECYRVKIRMPDVSESDSDSDMVFVAINGEKSSRDSVKNFLSEKMNFQNNKDAIVITLSDSEEETTVGYDTLGVIKPSSCFENVPGISNSLDCSVCSTEPSQSFRNSPEPSSSFGYAPKPLPSFGNAPGMSNSLDCSVCSTEPSQSFRNAPEPSSSFGYAPKPSSSFENAPGSSNSLEQTVCIIDSPVCTNTSNVQTKGFNRQKRKCSRKIKGYYGDSPKEQVRSKAVLSSEVSELCEVTSTTKDVVTKKTFDNDDCIIVLNETFPRFECPADFIPLPRKKRKIRNQQQLQNSNKKKITDIVSTVPSFRPIVIDGSNVAVEHGKSLKCFSAKGIKLAIDYFLNRGHKQVTAFVPRFRRHTTSKHTFPTTNPEILDDLAKRQHVVFTPSRRIEGKCIASYDDRFIVQLAATNKGVIVSNDNFRDLIGESDSFKEAIEERLLMFCFVGDIFMVPDDPLGRNGPKLNDFLCFPPEVNEK